MGKPVDSGVFQMRSDFVLVLMGARQHAAITIEAATKAMWPIASLDDVKQWAASRGLVLSIPAEAVVDKEPKQ